jgi:pimeloyl-ACP methyl ester carboxylesterase
MPSWQMVGTEVSALSALALSMPLRLVLPRERFQPAAPHPTPVILVHGFLGDPTNFLLLRTYLAALGVPNFATFAYSPRLDYQRLACRLAPAVEAVCRETGAARVDVVGHSLGGLVARYLVEMRDEIPVRRLVTLGAPYFASPLPPRELAIFAASDPFVAAPHPDYGPHAGRQAGRVVVIPHCGHWGLLYHPLVLREAADFLRGPGASLPESTLALDAPDRAAV